jgi:hypothetical protein
MPMYTSYMIYTLILGLFRSNTMKLILFNDIINDTVKEL